MQPFKIAQELVQHPLVLRNWYSFACGIGLSDNDFEVLKRQYNRGEIEAEELFTQLLLCRSEAGDFPISLVYEALTDRRRSAIGKFKNNVCGCECLS